MNASSIKTGDVFGRWTVIAGPLREVRRSTNSVNYITLFRCLCSCGVERNVRAAKLVRNSRSCGCLKLEQFTASCTRHGHNTRKQGRTKLYNTWSAMLQRCSNPKHTAYHLYGGRGITVCEAWRVFTAFAEWAAGNGYKPDLEIDRIDNRWGYSPNNCRWVTEAIQQRNKRTVWCLEAFGESKCLTDWALDHRCSVTPNTLRHRILVLGWEAERAITEPRKTRKRSNPFTGNHVPRPS